MFIKIDGIGSFMLGFLNIMYVLNVRNLYNIDKVL